MYISDSLFFLLYFVLWIWWYLTFISTVERRSSRQCCLPEIKFEPPNVTRNTLDGCFLFESSWRKAVLETQKMRKGNFHIYLFYLIKYRSCASNLHIPLSSQQTLNYFCNIYIRRIILRLMEKRNGKQIRNNLLKVFLKINDRNILKT